MIDNVIEIASKFKVAGRPVSFEECTAGHINTTYVVTFDNDGVENKYILQKINTYVFKDPDRLMSNIIGVTAYLHDMIDSQGGDADRGTLNFVVCNNGKYYFKSQNGECWRMYHYIDGVVSYSLADTTDLFEKAGKAFGIFQRQLARYDAKSLYETIPDFHNTPLRYKRFLEVLASCSEEKRREAENEIQFVLSYESQCGFIVSAINDGEIPVRVTHNDTKLNNILMDSQSGEGVCIIDLDTVMPGSALYDFGDAIRFGASSALEDEPDLDKVFFREDMFEAFSKGYVGELRDSLTSYEIQSLPMGALIITFETGLRFLTDFLENDVYFKTSYPGHNLVRAKNQFKLVHDLETRMDKFNDIIRKFI